MLTLNSPIPPYVTCFVGMVCSPVWSTRGVPLEEFKPGIKIPIVQTKVAHLARAGQTFPLWAALHNVISCLRKLPMCLCIVLNRSGVHRSARHSLIHWAVNPLWLQCLAHSQHSAGIQYKRHDLLEFRHLICTVHKAVPRYRDQS